MTTAAPIPTLRRRPDRPAATPPPHASPPRVACVHCGLDVPPGLIDPSLPHQYCCGGCRVAFETIHACGLDQYYALKARFGPASTSDTNASTGARSAPPPPARAYAEFDDPAFLNAYARPTGTSPTSRRVELLLEGVHCAACLWLIERLPDIVPGVQRARLDLRRAVVEIEWDSAALPLSRVAAALASLGYRPHPVLDSTARDSRRNQDRDYLVRIGVAAACAGNAMLLAFALYSGEFAGMHPAFASAFTWLSALIGILSLAWPGRVFITSALGAMRAGTWHLDMPIAGAMVIGNAAGLLAAIRGTTDIYADSLTMLVFLLLVGRWLQIRQQRYALDAVELLFSLTSGAAHLIDPDAPASEPRDVSIQSLRPGHIVEVRPQETFPIDGEIVHGSTSVDASILTGESRPRPATHGDPVVAGSVNLAATVRVRATAVGRETRAGRMMAAIEQLSKDRTPIIGAAHRLAAPFVIGVIALSIVTFAIHAADGPAIALRHAIALMVATCPCVVALATPLVVTLAVGRCSRRGVLVKGGDVFERLARPGLIVLDKTGTLTTGRFRVIDWLGDPSLRQDVAAIEAGSTHPIAIALAALPDGDTGDSPRAHPMPDSFEVEHILGCGVIAHRGSQTVHVGSPPWVALQTGASLPEFATAGIASARAQGHTPVAIAADGHIRAMAILGDSIRPDARPTLDHLRAHGWSIAMLSGDDPDVVRTVATSLGIDPALVRGGASPEDKQRWIADLKSRPPAPPARPSSRRSRSAPVVMVGDGVNDAPALAIADVGIAVRGGAEVSLAAADVYIGRGGIGELAGLSDASRRVLATIRRCLVAAVLYNLVSASLAVAGLLSPLVAAALMPISSLTVLTIAIRSRTVWPATERAPREAQSGPRTTGDTP